MRKLSVFLSGFILLFFLAACGGSEKEADSAGSKTLEASIEDASYILSNEGGSSGEEDGGLLKIDLLIKNVSDETIDVFPDRGIELYDEDTQIDPVTRVDSALKLDLFSNTSIGADKQKTMMVIFNVDKDKEYELNISPQSYDPEADLEDVTLTLDTSEYNDSLASLQDPEKALLAYIDTIYLDKENSDYEKLVSADKNTLQDDAEKAFKENLELGLSGKASDSDAEKAYKTYKQTSAEKIELEPETVTNSGDTAVVEVEYSAIPSDELSKKIRDYRRKYSENNDGFDPDKEDEYALSKIDTVIGKLDTKKAQRELEVYMKKEDGKWMIDDSSIDSSKRIRRIFAEGSVM